MHPPYIMHYRTTLYIIYARFSDYSTIRCVCTTSYYSTSTAPCLRSWTILVRREINFQASIFCTKPNGIFITTVGTRFGTANNRRSSSLQMLHDNFKQTAAGNAEIGSIRRLPVTHRWWMSARSALCNDTSSVKKNISPADLIQLTIPNIREHRLLFAWHMRGRMFWLEEKFVSLLRFTT
jgi:hypothetical protein